MKMTLLAVAISLAASAQAAEIYKCPNAAGKIEFTDRPCATGTKLTVQPNSVAVQDQSATRAKREAVDKSIAKMQAADVAENDRRARVQQARIDTCQGYLDEAARQRAWSNSISPAVRASATAEVRIQGRKYAEFDCDKVMR